MLPNITWLNHDSFKIEEGGLIIYTDPFQISKDKEADIIFISHPHYDHCSPEDVEKICGKNTTLITPSDCVSKLKGDIKSVKPGDSLNVKGVTIKIVPAYNKNKNFHPKANNWVGFVFNVADKKYYFAGDTDYIPEMDALKNEHVDIAFMPVSGTYVMTAEEAVKATLAIMPKVAVPMHYGSIIGSKKDAEAFKKGLKGKVEVVIL